MVFFDALFGYGDRTAQNPNCGIESDRLLVFDFEQIFGDRATDRHPEANEDLEDWEQVLQLHAFKGQARMGARSHDEMIDRFQSVQGVDWSAVIARLPKDWQPDAEELVWTMRKIDGTRLIPRIERRLG